MASRFTYRDRDRTPESVSRRGQGGNYDSYLISDAAVLKVKEGENCFRVLPRTWEDEEKWGNSWEIQVYLHYGIGPDNATYLCTDKMKGEPCPICEARHGLDEEESKALQASIRVLCWAIDRDNEKAGPQVWAMPFTLCKDIINRCIDKKTGKPILIDDPEDGFDIAFVRVGNDIKTKYTSVEIVRDPSPLHPKQETQDRWLDYIVEFPLPSLLNYYPADYVEKVMSGKVSARREDEPRSRRTRGEEEQEPARPRRRSEADEAAEDKTPRRREEEEPARETPRRRLAEADEEAPPRRRAVESEDEKGDDVSSQARAGLERLRARRGG